MHLQLTVMICNFFRFAGLSPSLALALLDISKYIPSLKKDIQEGRRRSGFLYLVSYKDITKIL